MLETAHCQKLQMGIGPSKRLSAIIPSKAIAISNGSKAKPQSTLLMEPVLFNPTLEKISLNDRRFSQNAKKINRKTRIPPQPMSIPMNKPKTNEIVMFCGTVPCEEPEPPNKIGMARYKVKNSHTMKGPFVSPSFLDAMRHPIPFLSKFEFSLADSCFFSFFCGYFEEFFE